MLPLVCISIGLVVHPMAVHVSRHGLMRHRAGGIVARELAFVADLEVETEPFAIGSKPLGDWFAREEALTILMSQAESSKRIDDGAPDSTVQRWEVATPIQFPGMVVRSETPMDISIDTATPRLSISSGASKTVCEGGPPWAQGLLARIGEIATTSSSNTIEVRDVPAGKVAVSRVNLTVRLNIPALLLPPFVPAGPFEKTGSKSIQQLLDKDMGPVLSRFRDAYVEWAS